MTRYCAQCGLSLEATALLAGYCPICGMEIDAADVGLSLLHAAAADTPTQEMAGAAGAADDIREAPDQHAIGAYLMPAQPQIQPQQHHGGANGGGQRQAPRRRHGSRLWALFLLSAVVLLLSGAAIYALAQHGTLSIVLAPFASSNANASSNSSSQAGGAATASRTSTGSSAQHAPTRTPRPGGTATPSPTGPSTPAPTATPTPPELSVSPTSFSFAVCPPINHPQFTITNTGGTPLSWSASAGSSGYKLTPTSGNLDPGQQVSVTIISTSLVSGTMTVSAPGARNAPQYVTVTCGA